MRALQTTHRIHNKMPHAHSFPTDPLYSLLYVSPKVEKSNNFYFQMYQGAFNPNFAYNPIGGVPTMGVVGGADVDPISPGLQTQPGTLTATGPSRVVGGGMLGSAYRGVGTGFGAVGTGFGGVGYGGVAGVVDADPVTPGIQAQPGVVTPTGPPRVVGAPGAIAGGAFASGYRGIGVPGVGTTFTGGIGGGVIDADPVTPGIQAQPGVVTPTGPPRIISGPGAIGGAGFTSMARAGFGAVDADPVTPGIQATPGVVTPTGPSQIVSGGYGYGAGAYPSQFGLCNNYCGGCPWWVWIIIGLLILGALVGGLYSWGSRRERGVSTAQDDDDDDSERETKTKEVASKDDDDKQDEETKTTSRTQKSEVKTRKEESSSSGDKETAEAKEATETTSTATKQEKKVEASDDSANTGLNISRATSDQAKGPEQESKESKQAASSSSSSTETSSSSSESTGDAAAASGGSQTAAASGETAAAGGESGESAKEGSSSSSSTKTTKKFKTRTVSKTTYQDQVVAPISEDPQYKHKHMRRAAY